MGALSTVHLIIILVIALLVIGPGKLPETGAALGRAIRDVRHATDGRLDGAPPPATTLASTPTGSGSAGPAPAPSDEQLVGKSTRAD
jgi:sec-independent protein translocase protein TatA